MKDSQMQALQQSLTSAPASVELIKPADPAPAQEPISLSGGWHC